MNERITTNIAKDIYGNEIFNCSIECSFFCKFNKKGYCLKFSDYLNDKIIKYRDKKKTEETIYICRKECKEGIKTTEINILKHIQDNFFKRCRIR